MQLYSDITETTKSKLNVTHFLDFYLLKDTNHTNVRCSKKNTYYKTGTSTDPYFAISKPKNRSKISDVVTI